jgi:hypothetical protein
MTTPNDAGRDFGTSDCSSAFTYDEIIALIRRKQKFWQDKAAKARTVEDSHSLHVFAAACDFIIQDFAASAADKQSKRLRSNRDRCHFCLGWMEKGKEHVCGYK